MGKRERRRRRERAKLEIGEPTVLLYPSSGDSQLRVTINAECSEQAKNLCARYWALDTEGTWVFRVADLGLVSWVTATVASVSHADVLHPGCGQEVVVRSRSEHSNAKSGISRCRDCAEASAESPDGGQVENELPEPPQDDGTVAEEPDDNGFELLPLELRRYSGVPEELASIGAQYWERACQDASHGFVHWSRKVTSIDTRAWGPAHIAAATGVQATVPTRSCSRCEGLLVLTSRTAYDNLCLGQSAVCVQCTPKLLEKMQRLLDPERVAQRRSKQAQAEEQTVRRGRTQQLAARWEAAQHAAVAAEHPVVFTPESPVPKADVRTEAVVLALLRFAPHTSPITPLRMWPEPLHPVPDDGATAVATAVQTGILAVHPDSPPTAFIWEPADVHEALTQAGGDVDAVPEPQLSNRYLPREASHYVPHGTSMGTSVSVLDAHLAARLEFGPDTAEDRQLQLVELVQEVIAAETVRYFDHQLEKRHLPPVPDHHVARLRDAAARAAAARSLGELNNLCWLAGARAADATQKNPQAPRANMSTYAVNTFETLVQNALADPQKTVKPYDHEYLSALARTVFYTILDAPPFTTRVDDVRRRFSRQPDAPGTKAAEETGIKLTLEPATLVTDVEWLSSHQDWWVPGDFYQHLMVLGALRHVPDAEADDTALGEAAHALHQILRDNSAITEDPVQAVISTCHAARLLTRVVAREGVTGAAGHWIVADFIYRTMGSDGAHP